MPDDVLSRPLPTDIKPLRVAYGSDPNQFGELWLPSSQHSALSTQQQPSAISRQPSEKQQQPQRLFPIVMNIHGGFWRNRYDLRHAGHLCAALARAGIAVWNLEYRRVGDAGGAWPGTFEDITSGWRFLRQLAARHPLDLSRAAAMGHSAGGHLAVALAAHLPPQRGEASAQENQGTPDLPPRAADAAKGKSRSLAEKAPLGMTNQDPSTLRADQAAPGMTKADNGAPALRGVVSLAGVLDLERAWELHLSNDAVVEFLGGTPEQMRDHYREADPMHLSVRCAQVLIHGEKDDTVPVSISRGYLKAKRARGEQVRLEETPSGHYELIDPEAPEWKVVVKAVGAAVGR